MLPPPCLQSYSPLIHCFPLTCCSFVKYKNPSVSVLGMISIPLFSNLQPASVLVERSTLQSVSHIRAESALCLAPSISPTPSASHRSLFPSVPLICQLRLPLGTTSPQLAQTPQRPNLTREMYRRANFERQFLEPRKTHLQYKLHKTYVSTFDFRACVGMGPFKIR